MREGGREGEGERNRKKSELALYNVGNGNLLQTTIVLLVVLSTWKWGKHLALHLYRNMSENINNREQSSLVKCFSNHPYSPLLSNTEVFSVNFLSSISYS